MVTILTNPNSYINGYDFDCYNIHGEIPLLTR